MYSEARKALTVVACLLSLTQSIFWAEAYKKREMGLVSFVTAKLGRKLTGLLYNRCVTGLGSVTHFFYLIFTYSSTSQRLIYG